MLHGKWLQGQLGCAAQPHGSTAAFLGLPGLRISDSPAPDCILRFPLKRRCPFLLPHPRSPIAAGYTREIIFLTDGGISGHEEQAVYDLVNPKAKAPVPAAARTHVLSLGIGHGVHRSLLDGMSTRSDGAVVYVVDDEAIAAKTAFLKKAATAAGAALRPRLVARNALVRPAPHVLPQRVFAGEPLHVLMEVVSSEPDAALELTADWAEPESAAGAAPLTLSLPLGPALASAEEGEALPVLHAMAYIGSLMVSGIGHWSVWFR